jgi:signal transduction histidine kinase
MLGVLLVGAFLISTLTVPDASALTYFLPVAYVLYLVAATYETKRDAVRVLVGVYLTLVGVAIVLVSGPGHAFNGSSLMPVVLCVIVAWTIGYSVRQRRRYAVRLQDEAASKAVAQERLRIARELHDVVAHSMSVIAVQAGYGQYVIDRQPGDARAALGAIQATSREALDEMRRMLGALRQADDADARGDAAGLVPAGSEPGLHAGPAAPAGGAPLYPAPGLADLDRLVARTASAGVRVDVTRFGQPRDLPASIDLSAYRIVQEALTNVVKHARTSSCRVLLGYRDDELTVEVTDNGAGMPASELSGGGLSGSGLSGSDLAGAGLAGAGLAGGGLAGGGLARHGFAVANGAALMSRNGTSPHGVGVLDSAPDPPDVPVPVASLPGAGHGIIGMRERVSLLGGEFSAGPLPGYGFRVSARIPLPVASA